LHLQSIQATEEFLEDAAAAIRNQGLHASTKVAVGTPFQQVIREVLRNGNDLVVVTAEGRGGLSERLFGSTTMHLMRKCPCPVWVIKPTQREPFRRILAAVNPAPGDETISSLNQRIMELAVSLAAIEESEIHIVRAWNLPGERLLRGRGKLSPSEADKFVGSMGQACKEWLKEFLKEFPLNDDILHHIHMVKDEAGPAIARLASERDIDLIVMGTVGRTGVSGLFIGNTAEDVLRLVECSVLAVKPEGLVSPVGLENGARSGSAPAYQDKERKERL
jgi:nucleotide-binding universal stress UspA family protein